MSDPLQSHPTLRHLEQLMAGLLDGVILIDQTGIILSANPAALRMHGVTTLEELGTTAESYAERFALRSAEGRALQRREYPLFRLLAGERFPDLIVAVAPAGDDEARWVHQVRDVTMDVDGGEADYLALVISDISARFDAEARFAAMFNANPAPALIVRLRDLRIVQANAGFLSLTGFARAQIEGRTLFGLDLLGGLAEPAHVRRAIEDGAVVPQAEAELLAADGSRRLVLFAGQPIDVTAEDALLLTFADLEPRRQAETALFASERQLLAVFEMVPVALAVTTVSDDRIIRVNAAFQALTGHDAAGAVGRTFAELALWETPESGETLATELVGQGAIDDRAMRIRSGSDRAIDGLISAATIDLDGASCRLWAFQDVTERRRSERDLGDAIDEVMKDASWLSRSILDKLATLRRPGTPSPAGDLSPREREVLDLICDDLDDQAIADRLHLSRNTVRNHVARVYAKIGVNRRSGAVVWGRERGMGSRQD